MNWIVVVVSAVVATLVAVSASIVLHYVQLRRQGGNDLLSNSTSHPKSMTRCLNTREDVARFVDEVRSLGNVSRSITITRLDSFAVFCVSCAINESSVPVLRAYLSRRLLTSLTPQELQSLENELRQVDPGRNGNVEYENVCRRSDLIGGCP